MIQRLSLLICCASLFACSRAGIDGSSSSLVIQTPTRQQLSKSGLQAFAALPTDRRICYGVSIKGVGIEGFSGSTCAPATGTVAGFVEEGSALEVFVAKGEGRTIELYAYLLPAGSTAACPAFSQNMKGENLRSTYLVGSKTGVSLVNDNETIEILLNFPGLSNHVASQLNVPATCTPGLAPSSTGFYVSSASGKSSNGTVQLRARIGRPQTGTLATGTGYKLYGNVR